MTAVRNSKAISGIAVALVLVIVVAAGAGAYYFVAIAGQGGNTSSSSHSTPSSSTSSSASSSSSSGTSESTSSSSTSSSAASTSSSTSSSSSSASTASSSSSTSTSTSCTTSVASTTGTGGSSSFLNFTTFFTNYSEVAIHYNGTSSGQSFNINEDYQVLAYTATGFRVNITASSGGNSLTYSAFIWRNGTAAWVAFSGQNFTGTYANSALTGAMAAYFVENIFTSSATFAALTDPSFVHITGQGNVMLGPTSVATVTYMPITLPLVFQMCGTSANFTAFTIQTGTVQGKSQVLLTKLLIAGTFNSGGTSSDLNFLLAITSVTKA